MNTASQHAAPAQGSVVLSGGLAFTPEKELELFAAKARAGQHLEGVALGGHGWRFVPGEPEDAVFDLAYEDNPSPDYFDVFRAAGWTPVVSMGNIHIFKAAPGTVPVHSGTDSRQEELKQLQRKYVRFSLVTLAVFALVGLLVFSVQWPPVVKIALLCVAVVPVVYTVLPLAGLTWRRRSQRQ